MRVKINELQEGCILIDDVFSGTNRPIIPKKTILSNMLIEVLQLFLIDEVNVEKTLVNGTPFIPEDYSEDENDSASTKKQQSQTPNLIDQFLKSVSEYKKEFISWQSGMPVDIAKIRSILLPLLEATEKEHAELFHLYHLSTREDYLYQHAISAGLISGYLAKKLQYPKGDYVQIAIAGCLADCGMAKINPTLLKKSGSLTLQEYEEVKKHPLYSYKMIQNITMIRKDMKIAILQHHERLDGTGYPTGEKEPKIHPIAKILAVADTFHAMTSERMYRNKQSPYKVIEMISQDSFGKFDLSILNALQSGIIGYSVGSRVKLSDGRLGEILFIDEKSPARPVLKLIESNEMLHLDRNRQIFIEESIS